MRRAVAMLLGGIALATGGLLSQAEAGVLPCGRECYGQTTCPYSGCDVELQH